MDASFITTPPDMAGVLTPDVPGLIGGTESYDATNAEEAAKFALTCAADERGETAPTDLTFEHYVPVGVAVTA
jgi:hypothetical protein